MWFSVVQLFISVWMKIVIHLKVKPGRQSLENVLSCVFQAVGNILLQRSRASIKKHLQLSAKVRAKGIDPIWSQVCSSLLHLSPPVPTDLLLWPVPSGSWRAKQPRWCSLGRSASSRGGGGRADGEPPEPRVACDLKSSASVEWKFEGSNS